MIIEKQVLINQVATLTTTNKSVVMNNLEEEFIRIGNQIDEAKNIQEVERLFCEIKKRWKDNTKKELTGKVRKLLTENFVFVIYKLREFYDRWGKSQVPPSDKEELVAAERIIKEIFKVIDGINKEDFPSCFGENYRSEAKKGLIALRLMIDEEISLRKS